MTVGENIRKIRNEKGLTQKQLGDLCEPKIAEANIRKYELNKANPKIETIRKIAEALGVYEWQIQYGMSEDEVLAKLKENRKNYAIAWNKKRSETEFLQKITSFQRLLNKKGQDKAIEQVEMLTKIPEYQKAEESKNPFEESDWIQRGSSAESSDNNKQKESNE